jgi:hypothetical protein
MEVFIHPVPSFSDTCSFSFSFGAELFSSLLFHVSADTFLFRFPVAFLLTGKNYFGHFFALSNCLGVVSWCKKEALTTEHSRH